jgi:4-diphosphocytidyl-2-C-methyl-D-erythritol kinase
MTLRALYDAAAPAKLNLFLHVIGRRPDGYHLLQSLFVLIDWADSLHFERRNDGRLHRYDLGIALPADDLCLRAARALRAQSGTALGAEISIDKRVPAGAGMGGGSSDAATVLLALNRLWGLNWPLARLMQLGLALGADVPFFLGGHNALVEGIGEQLTPLTVAPQWLAVIKPPASLSTPAIFGSPLLIRDGPPVILESLFAKGAEPPFAGFGRNDLQGAAEALCPDVRRAADLLEARFGNSRMTGSGSAVFAMVGADARPKAALPAPLAPGWVARMCRSLDHHPLLGWASG